MHRIVIIEDEFFANEHLTKLVLSLGYEVAGSYYSGEKFLAETDWNFEAALIDIFLEDKLTGLDIAEEMKKRRKHFIFLTANQDAKTLQSAAKLSPSAYLTKPFQNNDVAAAISILSNRMETVLEHSYQTLLRENSLTNEPLTSREIDILKGLVNQQTSTEICNTLFISVNTVKYHTKNIYRKLNVNSKTEIASKVNEYLAS